MNDIPATSAWGSCEPDATLLRFGRGPTPAVGQTFAVGKAIAQSFPFPKLIRCATECNVFHADPSSQRTPPHPPLTSIGGEGSGNAMRPAKRDIGFVAIIGLLAINALWLLWMPWSQEISKATMRRFHLQTGSFIAWAVQFPIPAMYNFANQAEIDHYPPGLVDPLLDQSEKHYLNHFPARCFTFADGRYSHLRQREDRWITIESSYRGRRLETRFHARPNPEGGFELIRLSSTEAKR
jgi:hypothetical protein